tara:strand:+ start:399 stop:2369 length:1971 start_codon:yes stop_codon:yes gene_type:complete
MIQRILSSFICLLLLTSIAPAAAATGPSDSVIWGVSYDWGNFEGDVLEMTGVDTNAANEDLEAAAEYAGFDLASDQVLSGSSHFFIESWDGDETVEIQDIHGNTHQVSQRITELTVRHGLLADAGFTASWLDNDEAIDIWYSASQEMALVIDATYVEYVDSDLLVYGADLEMSGLVSNTADLSMNLQVIAAGEVEAPEVDLGYSISMEVPSLSSEWRVDQPLDYLQQLNEEPNWDDENGSWDEENGSSGIGTIDGTFTTFTGYSLSAEISGIPTEEIGVNLDTFNVELSDNVPGQGSFSENFLNIDGQMAEWNWECPPVGGTEDLTIDDTTVEVQCGLTAPVSPGMAVMMAQSLAPAFDNGVQELSSVLQQQIESWIEEISGGDGGDDVFVCDNGEEIPAYWENDGEEDCSDGSDENDEGGTFTCDNGEEIPANWENDGEEDCSDGSDENDGSMEGSEQSERLVSMMEALMESNLNKTMEAFSEKLDELVEDNVPSEPIIDLEDSCALLFWTTDDSRVVGIAILNSEELLLGPSVFGLKTHDVELNVLYHDGDNARTAKTDIVGVTELRDIAPESKHDNSLLYEILGPDYLPDLNMQDTDGDGIIDYFDQDDDNDGISDWDDSELNNQDDSLPAPSLLAVISMLGAAAILMPRRDD